MVEWWPLFGPSVSEDDVDKVVAHERWVKVLQYIRVNRAEGAVRPVRHSVVERCQDAPLEIRARMSGGLAVSQPQLFAPSIPQIATSIRLCTRRPKRHDEQVAGAGAISAHTSVTWRC